MDIFRGEQFRPEFLALNPKAVVPVLVHDGFVLSESTVMTPYVNRLAALSMHGMWQNGRLPRVADWFERVRQRPTFVAAFVKWMPADLAAEMQSNGLKSWGEIKAVLQIR